MVVGVDPGSIPACENLANRCYPITIVSNNCGTLDHSPLRLQSFVGFRSFQAQKTFPLNFLFVDFHLKRRIHQCVSILVERSMETICLNQKQLANRWSINEATLKRWRPEGIGPSFLKLLGQVQNRLVDVEAFGRSHLINA